MGVIGCPNQWLFIVRKNSRVIVGRVSLMPFWSFASRGGLEDNMS
jgi:hypothetical protein